MSEQTKAERGRQLRRRSLAAAIAVVLSWSRAAYAQPQSGDFDQLWWGWTGDAESAGGLTMGQYDVATFSVGDWQPVYRFSEDFLNGSATSPYHDDLVVSPDTWVTPVYDSGELIGAMMAYRSAPSRPWNASWYGSTDGAAIEGMGTGDDFVDWTYADAAWVVNGETATAADASAEKITGSVGELADIQDWLRAVPTASDPNEVGAGGGAQQGSPGPGGAGGRATWLVVFGILAATVVGIGLFRGRERGREVSDG